MPPQHSKKEHHLSFLTTNEAMKKPGERIGQVGYRFQWKKARTIDLEK
jgi:hypothetical protein